MIIKMVNEFKLRVVHFTRENMYAREFTAEQKKNCGKSGLGLRAAGPLGRRPAFSKTQQNLGLNSALPKWLKIAQVTHARGG